VDFVASYPDLQAVVEEAVESPEAHKAVILNVAAVDKGEDSNDENFENAPAPSRKVDEDPQVEAVAEPTKRASKKTEVPADAPTKKSLADVVSAWSEDE
jgi:hypothetical protein